MPLVKAHACVVREAGAFDPDAFGKGVKFKTVKTGRLSVLIGKPRGSDKTATHSYHYPTDEWAADEARKHCQENDGRFEAAKKLEAMTVEELMDPEVNDLIPKE